MPKILSGTALPPHVKSKELIRKICSEDGAYNAISFADLQEFYIDRGVFTTDDLTFKQELLDDWLFSEELCDQYLQNNSPNTVTSTASESPPLPKRGELVPRVSFSSFIGPGKSPGDSHDVSASNSPRRRVYSTPPAPTSPTNSVQRSREISVRARIGIVSAVDGTIQDAQKTGCDKYDYNNTQQHESESTSISSQLKIVQQQRDILAQQVLIDQYYSHQIDQTNQNLGQGGLNSGLASGTGSGLGGTGSGSGYIQHPQQLAEKNNSGGGIGSLYIQDRVLGPSLDSDNINCLRSNGLHTSSNLKTETQIKMEQQRLLLRQQKQIMEKMKLSMIQHLGEDKPMLQLQQQQDGAQIVNQGSNLCSPQQQQQQQQREIPHAPGTPRLNYSYINTSMRGGALASARANQTSPEISVVPFTKEDHLELIKAIGALKNEVRDKNTRIEHIERLLVEYDQKKKENDRLLSMQESDIQEQQNMIQSQQHLIQAQQNMISKMQSTNSSSYDKYNVT